MCEEPNLRRLREQQRYRLRTDVDAHSDDVIILTDEQPTSQQGQEHLTAVTPWPARYPSIRLGARRLRLVHGPRPAAAGPRPETGTEFNAATATRPATPAGLYC